ncbi:MULTISPECIES: hypothetical protein [unclassified Yoonia]|uniref:hypothetical protein n=1 Tax=unclassified Yoonia TaxID=2629118 RepID=UPI002AFF1226|nr:MULTISPECIES: hypothetical protein [unclassified Yoonia]
MSDRSRYNAANLRYLTPVWIALLLSIIVAVWESWWPLAAMSSLTLILSLAPNFLASRYDIALPMPFVVGIVVFIVASLIMGEVFDIYYRIWWWDIALHATSAVALGMIGFLFIYMLFDGDNFAAPPSAIAFLAFTFALSIGAVWEIFEFAMDQLFGTNMQKSEIDTMRDLIFDAIGAIIGALAGYAYLKGRKTGLLSRLLNDFIKLNRHLYHKARRRDRS